MNVGSTYYGFIYNRFVTGRNFLGRKKDLAVLENSLKSGESVAIYDEPGTGKMSLIQQALTHLRISSPDLAVAQLSFQRERSIDRMLCLLLDEVIRACASTPAQYREIVNTSLADTHFVFDQALFDVHGRIVGTNWVLDQKDIQSALELPDALAQNRGTGIIIVIDEFQNLLMAENADKVLDIWEKIQARQERLCSYVFTGSRLNGMRDIFEVQRRFRHDVTRLIPECIPSGDIAEYVDRIFRNQGKVIEKEAIAENAVTLRCNMRYVNHLFSLVDYSTRGFVGNSDISDALETLMTIHEPRFFSAICSLTDFQLSLLRAIVDGEVKFSSSVTIDKYRLNSSANVKRLKEALVKKEIVWFDNEDVPHIQDPLMEMWLRKVYFAD